MAHFAEINESNEVVRVLVTDNNDPAGDEGHSWLVNNLGGIWIQTSYNGKFRGRFAGVGFTYDKDKDEFIAPLETPPLALDGYEDGKFIHTTQE